MSHKIFRLISSLVIALAVMFAGVAPALAAPVVLDPTFDTDGIVTTNFGNQAFGAAVTLQPDAKIIVAGAVQGAVQGNNYDFALARYNNNGSLDTTFDTDGMVSTPISSNDDIGLAVALQSDGKIVVAGRSHNGIDDDFALARYNSNGSLDTTFDTDGKVTTNFNTDGPLSIKNDNGSGLAIQSDGKIVVAGYSYNTDESAFALARYNNNGSLDMTFDTDGKVTTTIGTGAFGGSVALQPDGKILVAGVGYHNVFDADFALARYNNNGSLDMTFDTDGIVTTDFGHLESASAMAIQFDGKIIVAGLTNLSELPVINDDFALARYNTNGSLDTTFSVDGKVTSDFGSSEPVSDMAIQSDGKIVLAGFIYSDINSDDFALVRYDTNGSLDTTFDTDGIVTTSIGNYRDLGHALAIQSDGKIIVAGEVLESPGRDDFALARFNVENSSSTEVTIDIKPGRFQNRVKLARNVCRDDDNLYVAILTTPAFNARTVDVSSLQLGDPNLSGKATPLKGRVIDVDLDGDKDMVLVFTLCGIATNGALNLSSTEMVLTGRTLEGATITGRDSVKVVSNSYP